LTNFQSRNLTLVNAEESLFCNKYCVFTGINLNPVLYLVHTRKRTPSLSRNINMKLSFALSIGFSSLVFGNHSQGASTMSLKPPFFLLAGDSTTATQSSNGGGWGDGSINKTLFQGTKGRNFGHN
jgi:hypothetical protein